MGKNRRTFAVVMAGISLLTVAVFLLAPASGQIKIGPGGIVVPGTPPGKKVVKKKTGVTEFYSAVQVGEGSDSARLFNVARDCIKDQTWNDAAKVLQHILDQKEDAYIKGRGTSMKRAANKLLGTMPQAGLNTYEVFSGGKARALLEEAKKTGSIDKLADVAQRYLHTQAGPEANELLATHFLDRGQFFMASLQYQRLLSLPESRYKASDVTLLKAALAFRRRGDNKSYQATWDKLKKRMRRAGGITLGKQFVAAARLQKMLTDLPQPRTADLHDRLYVRGDISNSAQANGSPPVLDNVIWERPLYGDRNEITGEVDPGAEAENEVNDAVKNTGEVRRAPVMPGFFPIAVGGKLIYRNYNRLMVRTLKEIVDEGETLKLGEIYWQSGTFNGALAVLLSNPATKTTIKSWMKEFESHKIDNLVYENTLVGTVSSDMHRVYAVDDLAVPLPPSVITMLLNPRTGSRANIPHNLVDRVYNNSLLAYNVESGKLTWSRGGKGQEKRIDAEFQDSLFMGPPVSVGGKLYVMNEKKDGELRLVALDPTTGKVVSMQSLGTVKATHKLIYDATRRMNAVHMAYGEGIIVCPTNAGTVFGIDLLGRTLAWAYDYREVRGNETLVNPGFPGAGMAISLSPTTWKVAPPIIYNGKVVFTAPDAHSLHCLNLHDGTMAWRYAKEESDLFLGGVFDDKVLVIGKNRCRFIRLTDGKVLDHFDVTTGDLPSGQGIASNNVYYLPLQNKEIVAIDIKKMAIKAHNRAGSNASPRPGNLVFYEGAVISQTYDKIVTYPRLANELAIVKAKVRKNPSDWSDQIRLGEMLLASGNVNDAVSKFRYVKKQNLPDKLKPRVRQRIYEALTDLFQTDFKTASTKYMSEYQAMLKQDAGTQEEQQRRGKFLRILGEGRERMGDLVAAYDAYRQFEQVDVYRQKGVPAVDDPQRRVPMQIWLKTRIASMFERAKTPAIKKPLIDKITKDWLTVRDSGQMSKIRVFASMFDTPFKVGREARIYMADAILAKKDKSGYLEAELKLGQVHSLGERYPVESAKALETMARLEKEYGETGMRTAATYYRRLADKYPNVVIRNGKTGRDYFDELASNKTFLPYLETARISWPSGPIKAQELSVSSPASLIGLMLQPKGELSPSTNNLRLMMDFEGRYAPKLRLMDLTKNKIVWSVGLKFPASNNSLVNSFYSHVTSARTNSSYYPQALFRFYHIKGRLAAVQMAAEVYGVDLQNGKILWHYNLADISKIATTPGQRVNGYLYISNGRTYRISYYDSRLRRTIYIPIGHIGTVQSSYVLLINKNKLIAVDPLKGHTLWTKDGVSENARVFGDGNFIYLVDDNFGAVGGARVLRASDGARVQAPNFGAIYQNRIAMKGRRILSATPEGTDVILRLYDIPTGKDIWRQNLGSGAQVLRSSDPNFVGAISPKGFLSVYSGKTGKFIVKSNVLQERVSTEDLKSLYRPLLMVDDDRFYVALNKSLNLRGISGTLMSNFSNSVQTGEMNGWLLAFHRRAGSGLVGGKKKPWKAGELHWISSKPITNQLVVLEQFRKLPVLLFSSRYNQLIRDKFGRSRYQYVSMTQSIDKRTGKWVHCPLTQRTLINTSTPRFHSLIVRADKGEISMVGYSDILQHYVDDGRPRPKGAVLKRGTNYGTGAPPNIPFGPGGIFPGGLPGGGFAPPGGFGGPVPIAPPPPVRIRIRGG